MIEFCTVRRMIATIVFLGIVTIVSVIIESRYELPSIQHNGQGNVDNHQQLLATSAADLPCWFVKSEHNKVVEDCRYCFKWEMSYDYCLETGYREKIQCPDNKTGYVSCPVPSWVHQRGFWIHESVWLAVGVMSFTFVHMRRAILDHQLMEKVNRQIASGV